MATSTPAAAAAAAASTVSMRVSCKSLPKNDLLSQSDPVAALYVQRRGETKFSHLASTELQKNEANPVFESPVELTFAEDDALQLKLCVFDADDDGKMDEKDMLGVAKFDTAAVTAALAGGDKALTLPLVDNTGKAGDASVSLTLTRINNVTVAAAAAVEAAPEEKDGAEDDYDDGRFDEF
jgi:hypothetical protein